ncbi:unnamed protein product [Boreogadus saida]
MFVLFHRAEENAHAFLDKELKKLWRDLFPDYPQCSELQREEEELDGKNEEQRRRAIEGVVDITKLCLMEMNQEELADTLGGADAKPRPPVCSRRRAPPPCLQPTPSPAPLSVANAKPRPLHTTGQDLVRGVAALSLQQRQRSDIDMSRFNWRDRDIHKLLIM